MKKILIRFLICVQVAALISCREDFDPTPYTYTQLLTGKISRTWELSIIEETLDGKMVDRFELDCANDDEYIFNSTSDRLYEVKTGSNKCSNGEPALITDTWSFNNATATLVVILPFLSSNQLPFIVRKLDNDDLTLEIFFDESGTASYKIYFKLKDEE
jgi:hypothetical protein